MSAPKRRSHVLLQAVAVIGVIAGWAIATRADYPISEIVAIGDPAPDSGTFTSFEAPVGDREDDVYTGLEPLWFEATTSNGVSGVYVYDAIAKEYFTLADTTMTVPQGGATFTGFSNLSSGFGELGFLATDSNSNNQSSVYAIGSFPLTLIATPQTLTPSGVAFGNFQSISIKGGPDFGDFGYGYGYENGEIESDTGIYDFVGSYNPFSPSPIGTPTFTLVANTSTTPPGASGPFTSFGPTSYKSFQSSNQEPGVQATIRAVCATAGGVEGIYWGFKSSVPAGFPNLPAPLVSLVNVGDAVPDSNANPTTATFTSFGNPIATSNEVSFIANYSGDQQGVFSYGPYIDGSPPANSLTTAQLRELVATGQVAPNSSGAMFTGFLNLTDSGFAPVFLASLSDGNSGLYASSFDPFNSEILSNKVLETGDTLDGKTVSGIDLFPDSINPLTFLVDFTDGSQGLYYVGVPEPVSLCLMALPLFLLPLRRRSHGLSSKSIGIVVEPLEQRRLLSLPTPVAIGVDAHSVFGADNGGTTDASTAINNAIGSLGSAGGVVYLPEGTYLTDSPIVLNSNVTLRGESATGTIIDYTGSAGTPAIEMAAEGQSRGVQNLTIISDNGEGLAQQDLDYGIVSLDVENVKFETAQTAINFPGGDGGQGSQDSYFHNIDISVGGPDSIDPETSIYLDSGAEAINVGGNANDIDGLVISGSPPTTGYNGPGAGQGIIDIHRGLAILLENITIDPCFGSVPVTDFYFSDARNLAMQDVQFAPAQTGVDSTRLEIINSDVTMDNLTLDGDDKMDVQYSSAVHNNAPIVVVDHLQIPTTGTLSNYIQADSVSEVHISGVNDNSPSQPLGVTLDDPAVPTLGVKVPTDSNDSGYADYPVTLNSQTAADQNTDSLNHLISAISNDSDANYTLWFPAGTYYISSSLLIPTNVKLIGVGDISSVISNYGDFNDVGDGSDLGLLELDETGGQAVSATIADLGLVNTTAHGYGISAYDEPITVDHLNVDHVGFATGTATTAIEQPNRSYIYTGDGGPGIYLPEGQATVIDSTFIGITNAGHLFGSLVNIYGDGNTFERCSDSDDSDTYAGQTSMIIVSASDSTDPTNILCCDTERGAFDLSANEPHDDQMYDLSGPNINFFANYISDNANASDIVLDGATKFNADSLGTYGSVAIEEGTTADVRYADFEESQYTPSQDQFIDYFADPATPSDMRVVMHVDDTSKMEFGVVRFYNYFLSVDGVPDNVLTNPQFDIKSVNFGSLDTYHTVLVANSSSAAAQSSLSDPNQISVSGGKDFDINGDEPTQEINVIDNANPYFLAPDANTTLILDWSNGVPDFTSSLYFEGASGYTNKLIIDDPTDASDLTIVQGPPDTDAAGTFGISNVQEIDTGSGSYDVTLDLNASGLPSTGLYYNGSAGSDNELYIESPTTFLTLTEGAPAAAELGFSNVTLINPIFVDSVYFLTLEGLGDGTTLSSSGDLLDVNSQYSINTDNVGMITFSIRNKGGGGDATISSLPNGPSYRINSYGCNLDIDGMSSDGPFVVGNSYVKINGNEIDINNETEVLYGELTINLHDGSAPGYLQYDSSDGTPMDVNYAGSEGDLYISAAADSYTFVPAKYSGVVNVIFQGGEGDTLSLPLQQATRGSPGFPLPSYTITFNGSGGDDTVDITADSTYNSFEIGGSGGSDIIINGDYTITTTGVEHVNITGGSEADTFTVDPNPSFSTISFAGGSGDTLKLKESADNINIIDENDVTYGNTGTAVNFNGVPSVTIQGNGTENSVSADGDSTDEFDINGDDTLSAFGRNFAFNNVQLNLTDATVVYNAPAASGTFHAFDDGTDKFTDGTITIALSDQYLGKLSSLVINMLGGTNTFWAGLGSSDIEATNAITINMPEVSGNLVKLEAASAVNSGTIYLAALNVSLPYYQVVSGSWDIE